MNRLLLAVLLFFSGAAGLAYEVVWLRLVSNCTGSSAAATAVTLAVFMAGMAMGSLALGRWADRARHPLRLYAVLELGLAAWAALLPWLLSRVPTVDGLLPGDAPGSSALLVRVALAAVLLLVPTFLMGGTLPAIAAHLAALRRGDEGRGLSTLYGIHVLGAASGCLLASFVLIRALGLAGTSRVGALVNLLVAAGCWFLARPGLARSAGADSPGASRPAAEPAVAGSAVGDRTAAERDPEALPATTPAASESGAARQVVLIAGTAFASGFLLLGSEVVFVRTLVMALSAKVHSFAMMLATFLIGLSIGSFIASRIPMRWTVRGGPLALAFALGAVGLLWSREVPMERAVPLMLSLMEDQAIDRLDYLRMCVQLSALSLLPVAIPLGLVLPLLLRVASVQARPGRAVGGLVFFNTLGSVLGPLLTPFVLVPWLGLMGVLYCFAVAAAALAALWCLPALSMRRGLLAAVASLLLLTALGVDFARQAPRFGGTPELDSSLFGEAALLGTGAPNIVHHVEGATGTVSVVRRGGRAHLRLDGFEAAGVPEEGTQQYQYLRLMAHFPMIARGPLKAQRALVICCGTGTTAGALTEYPLQQLDLVDIHPEVLDQLPYFAEHNRDLATNPACRKIADDGRAHVRRMQDHYDVITLEPMPPQHAGMTNLYSREFYEDCRGALRDGGVVCQWLPYHLVSREQALAITRAMAEVFPTVQVWEHRVTGVLLGSLSAELPLDAEHFDQAMALPGVRADLAATSVTDLQTLADAFLCRADDLQGMLDRVEPITDDRPDLEYGDVGYGLSAHPLDVLASIREPFFAGRLAATLPLRNCSEPQRVALSAEWKARSCSRYCAYLSKSGRVAEALELLEAVLRDEPTTAARPVFRQALERARRRVRSGGP